MRSVVSMLSSEVRDRDAIALAYALWGIALGLLIAVWHLLARSDSATTHTLLSTLIVANGAISALTWWLKSKSIFDPYIVFLAAAYAFNGGEAILHFLGLNGEGFLHGAITTSAFDENLISKTLLLVLIGLWAFHFGALIGVHLFSRRNPPVARADEGAEVDAAFVVVGTAMILGALPFWIVRSIERIQIVMNSGYAALYQAQSESNVDAFERVFAGFLTPGAVLLLIGGRRSKWAIGLSGLLVISSTAVFFFMGHRAPAMWPLIAYVWAVHRVVRPLPTLLLGVGGALIVSVVMPLVQVVRSAPGTDRFSLSYLVQSYMEIDNPIVLILREMGKSMRTVAASLLLIPSEREFDFGLSYFYAATAIVPNFFWEIHPATGRTTLSQWLVERMDPAQASIGGGWGFSFLAEAYANFGWTGLPIVAAVLGCMLGSIAVRALRRDSIYTIAFAAIVLGSLARFARGETILIIRPIVWHGVLPLLATLIVIAFFRSNPKMRNVVVRALAA